MCLSFFPFIFFFFNDTATTEIYTLSLHDALPISAGTPRGGRTARTPASRRRGAPGTRTGRASRRGTRGPRPPPRTPRADRKSTRLKSSHANISYAVFFLKKKKKQQIHVSSL